MNQPDLSNLPADTYVWGIHVPYHWYQFLQTLGESESTNAYGIIRKRMLANNMTDAALELEAERLNIPTLNMKQRVIADLFKDEGLPSWNLPKPKARRVMTKGRKALRQAVEQNTSWANKRPSHAKGVWTGFTTEEMQVMLEICKRRGQTPDEFMKSLFIVAANKFAPGRLV